MLTISNEVRFLTIKELRIGPGGGEKINRPLAGKDRIMDLFENLDGQIIMSKSFLGGLKNETCL